jgi:preprotein translocase subunit YajC
MWIVVIVIAIIVIYYIAKHQENKAIINLLKKYWWIVLIIIIGFGLFYWFQLRPAQIRRQCMYDVGGSCLQNMITGSRCETQYKACLLRNGITK